MTRREGATLLGEDVVKAERAVNRSIDRWIPQNQFDALISFTFNLGKSAQRFNALATHERG